MTNHRWKYILSTLVLYIFCPISVYMYHEVLAFKKNYIQNFSCIYRTWIDYIYPPYFPTLFIKFILSLFLLSNSCRYRSNKSTYCCFSCSFFVVSLVGVKDITTLSRNLQYIQVLRDGYYSISCFSNSIKENFCIRFVYCLS